MHQIKASVLLGKSEHVMISILFRFMEVQTGLSHRKYLWLHTNVNNAGNVTVSNDNITLTHRVSHADDDWIAAQVLHYW